jgi:hypothetical protein
MMKEARTPVATGVYIASDALPEASQIAHFGVSQGRLTRWQTLNYGFGRYHEHTRGEPESRANVVLGVWTRDQSLLGPSIGGSHSRSLKEGEENGRTPLHPWPLKNPGDNWLKFAST